MEIATKLHVKQMFIKDIVVRNAIHYDSILQNS